MRYWRNLHSEKHPYLFVLLLLVISAIIFAFGQGNDGFDTSRREVLLRNIGHELLLLSGDSTSRVLPIEKIGENEYQISFEHELTFQPGSLVNTTQRVLAMDPLTDDYVVNVLNCANAGVVYSYAISQNKKDDIVPCRGRRQPAGCYMIDIQFKPTATIAKNKYMLGALSLLAFVGFVFLRSSNPRRILPESRKNGSFTLGSLSFDTETRKLKVKGKTVTLTKTEARVLHIFALSPNKAVERSRLQKEVWEDEGVIVGRSLDMFISRLRKKLAFDPNINIVVIRGLGYKLEVR